MAATVHVGRWGHGGGGLAQWLGLSVPRVPGRVQLQEGGQVERTGRPAAHPPGLGRGGPVHRHLLG